LRPRDRPTAWAADQIRGGLDEQLELAAGVRGREDLEPGESEQGNAQRRRIVFHPGASHARVRLAVITNREGPGTYLSSSAQRRPVATQAHKSQVRCEE